MVEYVVEDISAALLQNRIHQPVSGCAGVTVSQWSIQTISISNRLVRENSTLDMAQAHAYYHLCSLAVLQYARTKAEGISGVQAKVSKYLTLLLHIIRGDMQERAMAQVRLERLSGAGRWLAKTTGPVRVACPINRMTCTPHRRKTGLRKPRLISSPSVYNEIASSRNSGL